MKGLITSNQRRASIWQLAAHWTRFAASLLIGGGSGLGFADWLAPAVLLWGNYYCALYRERGGRRDWWLKMKILTKTTIIFQQDWRSLICLNYPHIQMYELFGDK